MSEERDWDEAHREPVQTTPRYEHYQFQEKPRTVVTKPGKSGNRKPGSSFGKKLGTTVALAVVFGLVASAVYPDDPNWSFQKVHDYCYERGFTIYPGKVTTTDTFRLCALGAIDVEDIEEFFKVLREALIENNIQVPVQYR